MCFPVSSLCHVSCVKRRRRVGGFLPIFLVMPVLVVMLRPPMVYGVAGWVGASACVLQ